MKISADEIHDSLERSGKVPHGWKPMPGRIRKVRVKNHLILDALRAHYPGEWRKIYRRGRDGTEFIISSIGALEKSGGLK
jgi:hypothetical protein